MALKKKLNDQERHGLTEDEIKQAERFLRKNKTAGAIPKDEALKLYEMYLIGCSFQDIVDQYPKYQLSQLILTAALHKWVMDRDRMLGSIKGRVQAKVVKSIVDSVDFLTTMISVTNTEVLNQMRQYILDPVNNTPPDLRIKSIKDYKDILETLQKLVSGSGGAGAKNSTLTGILASAEDKNHQALSRAQKDTYDAIDGTNAASIIAAEVDSGNE